MNGTIKTARLAPPKPTRTQSRARGGRRASARVKTARRAPQRTRRRPQRAIVQPADLEPWAHLARPKLMSHQETSAIAHGVHISAIAFLYQLQGALSIFAGLVLGLLAIGGAASLSEGPLGLLLGGMVIVPAMLAVSIGAVVLVVGNALRDRNHTARLVVGALVGISCLLTLPGLVSGGLLGLVVLTPGLAWNLGILWALYGTRGAYVFEHQVKRESRPLWISPFFYLPVGLFLLSVTFALGSLVLG